jgi:aminopeptidase N
LKKRLEDFKEAPFKLDFVNLDFHLGFEKTVVLAEMSFSEISGEIVLNWEKHGKILEFKIDDEVVQFRKKVEFEPHRKNLTISLKTEIYPDQNTELSGLYKSGEILATQNEAEGFRRIIPFPDRPDVMTKFTTKIVANKKYFPNLLSNGNLVESGDLEDGKHFAIWRDPHKKPAYLFALVGGDLDLLKGKFVTKSGRKVELHFYTDPNRAEDSKFALQSLQKAMKWDEERFGLEYDLDIYQVVAVSSFNMGAMENKGLNIFNSAYLLSDSEKSTDGDYLNIESVIAHEYFHNWTGNRVTLRDWFQLTLKEGLTVFRDQLFSEDIRGFEVQRISDIARLHKFQFTEDSSPNSHPIQPTEYLEIDNFYTFTVYEKGAEVIRSLHKIIGETGFQRGMKLYFKRHDGQAVRVEEFLNAMIDSNPEIDLSDFHLWYREKGTPKIEIYSSKGKIHIDRLSEHKAPIPIEISLNGKSETAILRSKSLEIELKEKAVPTFDTSSTPIISKFRDSEFHHFQLKHGKNISKYASKEEILIDALVNLQPTIARNKLENDELLGKYIENLLISTIYILKDILLEDKFSASFHAKMLAFPEIENVFSKLASINLEETYLIYEKVKESFYSAFTDEVEKFLSAIPKTEQTDLSNEAIGNRALKCAIIEYLPKSRASEIYWNSPTMTEKMVAMKIANDSEIFSDYLKKFSDDSDMVSKYFRIVGGEIRENPIPKIEEILKSELFDYKVPNLVRGLLGSFGRNYKYLFTENGIKLFVRELQKVDGINPNVASRLCESFNIYPKLSSGKKELLKNEISGFLNSNTISKNSFEILSNIFKK